MSINLLTSWCFSFRSCYFLSIFITFHFWIHIFSKNRCSVCLYFHLFVGRLVSYLRYLRLFAHSLVQHMLCCVFSFFFFFLCTLCGQFLCIVHFWLTFRYSLLFTGMYMIWYDHMRTYWVTDLIWQDYAQTNANNVNKTRAFLQTNGNKDKPNIGFCWNRSEHRYPNMELRT
jgi:hypothetical protein